MISTKNYRFHVTLARSILFFCLLISFIGFTLYRMQIIEYNAWLKLSKSNQFAFQTVPPERGFILDRNENIIASNQSELHLQVRYLGEKNMRLQLERLSQLLQKNIPMPAKKHLRFQKPVTVLTQLSQTDIQTLYNHAQRIPNMRIVPTPKRYYPLKEALATVSGYVKTNKTPATQTYGQAADDTLGVGGVEQYYQNLLSGRHGANQQQRNAKGCITHNVQHQAPTHGDDLILTIDNRIQSIIHKHMQGLKGAVVITHPYRGEILGLYSGPSFDPNLLINQQNPKILQSIFNHPNSPLLNRTTRGLFPPASTVKPFLSLYALEHQLITPDESIYDKGYYRYKDSSYFYHNWLRSGHGHVNLHKAIVLSNDTYFYELGMKIGIDHISKALMSFGFESLTGIDLPGEKTGYVPSRKKHQDKGKSWLIGETIISVIGQGENLITPIGLARALNILATRGIDRPLHLLKAIKHRDSAVTIPPPQQNASRLSLTTIKSMHWNRIHAAMQDVTLKGTGVRFGDFQDGFASKTGTAQLIKGSNRNTVQHQKDHSWFIGFTPIKKPKLSIVVLIENENTAILVAKEIMQELKNIPELWI